MGTCLVQQLFRLKIGKGLDPSIVDEVLFPLLRPRKHGPKELLQDIKLTQSCNEYGQSAIVVRGRRPLPWHKNISPFPESGVMKGKGKDRTGMRGSIDIINELRSLIQPQFGQHRPVEVTIDPGRIGPRPSGITGPQDEFGGIYILLEEVPPWSCRQEKRLSDLKFMNDYLDDALNTGKCISWTVLRSGRILSTYY
jgi:hypothetical protein